MSLFGKKDAGKTVLILDIENGSVGSTLARLSHGKAPRLFGESRIQTPLFETRSALHLFRAVEHAAQESLLHASEVAARLRHGAATQPLGQVEKVVIFLAAPWGTPNLEAGRPNISTALTQALAPHLSSLFNGTPVAHHVHASAAVHGLRMLYPQEPQALLLSVNGEVSELLLLEEGHVVGHATIPLGTHTVLRTLRSHGGLSEHEARSALHLGHLSEPMAAAAGHFAGEFKEVAGELLAGQPGGNVFVLAQEPAQTWFAKALSHPSLISLFPQGGEVRAIHSGHTAPFVSSQATRPDVHLMLDALYTTAAHA